MPSSSCWLGRRAEAPAAVAARAPVPARDPDGAVVVTASDRSTNAAVEAALGCLYREAMNKSELIDLERAYAAEGLEDEIALLRVRLKAAAREHPEKLELLLRGVGMLVRAVTAQYRLSPKARKDMAENVEAVLKSLDEELGAGTW